MIRTIKLKLVLVAIVISSVLLLLPGISLSSLSQNEDDSENETELTSQFLTTPTPYPLPKQTLNQSSLVTTLWRQLFGRKNSVADPSVIIQNSQKIIENDVFKLYVEDDQLKIDTQWWQQESENVYQYVSLRMD